MQRGQDTNPNIRILHIFPSQSVVVNVNFAFVTANFHATKRQNPANFPPNCSHC